MRRNLGDMVFAVKTSFHVVRFALPVTLMLLTIVQQHMQDSRMFPWLDICIYIYVFLFFFVLKYSNLWVVHSTVFDISQTKGHVYL